MTCISLCSLCSRSSDTQNHPLHTSQNQIRLHSQVCSKSRTDHPPMFSGPRTPPRRPRTQVGRGPGRGLIRYSGLSILASHTTQATRERSSGLPFSLPLPKLTCDITDAWGPGLASVYLIFFNLQDDFDLLPCVLGITFVFSGARLESTTVRIIRSYWPPLVSERET